MNPLDQLQPLTCPRGSRLLAARSRLVAAVVAWRLRVLLPVKASQSRSEQPLDPVRVAALAELASLPKPYDGAPAGAWLQQAATTTRTARATRSMAGNGWRFWITAAPPPA